MAKHKSPEYVWQPLIEASEDVGVFIIQSERDPSVMYRIDLLCYNGKGKCDCEDFQTRIGPYRDRGVEPHHKNCKHIRMAFAYVGEEIIARLSRSRKIPQHQPANDNHRRIGR